MRRDEIAGLAPCSSYGLTNFVIHSDILELRIRVTVGYGVAILLFPVVDGGISFFRVYNFWLFYLGSNPIGFD